MHNIKEDAVWNIRTIPYSTKSVPFPLTGSYINEQSLTMLNLLYNLINLVLTEDQSDRPISDLEVEMLYLFCFVDYKAASLICHRQNESLFWKRLSSLFANTRTCNLRPQCLLRYADETETKDLTKLPLSMLSRKRKS
jgi:hypothetical protein